MALMEKLVNAGAVNKEHVNQNQASLYLLAGLIDEEPRAWWGPADAETPSQSVIYHK
jgi:hypothetical protein